MKKILTLLFTLNLAVFIAKAQDVTPVNGLNDERDIQYALIHATVWQDPTTQLKDATLIIRKNKVEMIGVSIPIPPNAVILDFKDQVIYPAFIDLYSSYGMPEVKKLKNEERYPQYETSVKGAYSWNQALKPEFEASRNFVIDEKKAEELRKFGFGAVLTLQQDGIARGVGSVVALGNGKEAAMILKDRCAAGYSLKKGSSTQEYPNSMMGSIALLRQTYLDADWYRNSIEKNYDISLEAWLKNQTLLQLFEVGDYRSALRADKIGDEFGVNYVIKGGGDEYKRVDEIKNGGNTYIIPINFPDPYDVSNPFDALNISIADLKNYELAPYNLVYLKKAGINFSITASDIKEPKVFLKNLQRVVKNGLSKEEALKALTTTPAELVGLTNRIGSLKKGMDANFFISSKDIFEKDAQILESWIEGKRYIIKATDSIDLRGNYKLQLDTLKDWNLSVSGSKDNLEWKFVKDTLKFKVDYDSDFLQFSLKCEPFKGKGFYRLVGQYDQALKSFKGNAQLPDGRWSNWSASYSSPAEEKKDTTSKSKEIKAPGAIWYPMIAFGNDTLPRANPVLIKNITVWTNEKEGILKETDVFINNGKIEAVGKNLGSTLKISGLQIIDGTGRHLTSGLIDEHSHIGVNDGVNEGTQSVTAEVRIGDILTGDDINIYRQLAGGVTTIHILHGSANAIGGQTALIKLRWGQSAERLKFENADGFIKFALGENVKQSNWGDFNTIRYPQTRMGVEQVYIDAFTRARAYDKKWKQYNSLKDKKDKPRKDLELEALSEILNKKRFITCHSYQQGEINMLMHVADTFGFKVNTFTHILEGYKVADKMKVHGAGASSFSDWWAYKFEVMEAIPYNGAILNQIGVVTAFNSDDAEMARRLNQEAAKAIKYGKVSEEDALKFVTLNPAKLLHIDNRVGSIRVGKDADVVIWNDNPLSIYAKPLKTFVDGICYFDIDQDRLLRNKVSMERDRLIKLCLEDKALGASTQKAALNYDELYHCNDDENNPR
jgi:imidazolonepropionase-like amidohydrolase